MENVQTGALSPGSEEDTSDKLLNALSELVVTDPPASVIGLRLWSALEALNAFERVDELQVAMHRVETYCRRYCDAAVQSYYDDNNENACTLALLDAIQILNCAWKRAIKRETDEERRTAMEDVLRSATKARRVAKAVLDPTIG